MTYQHFKDALLAELAGCFPNGTDISILHVQKNNSVTLDGLTIREDGCAVAPTIYLEEFYERLTQGETFPALLSEILSVYHRYRPQEAIDPSFFRDFSVIRSRIVYKLVHYDKNKLLLNEIPHVRLLDLAVVFCCLLETESPQFATILIRNEHLSLWQITPEDLMAAAKENTPHLLPPELLPLSKLLESLCDHSPCAEESFSSPPTLPIYVLTNQKRFLGAACLLYDHAILSLADEVQSDFYVIPSSIHEILLVPVRPNLSREDINAMICEVNKSEVAPEEILSDHVYYYNRAKDCIEL